MIDVFPDLTPKQRLAFELLKDPGITRLQLYGGARAGKTVILVSALMSRAMFYPESPHLIARYSRTSAEATIWTQTVLPIAEKLESGGLARIYHSKDNLKIQLVNGSYVRVDGLEPSRIDKVLSSEYATIFVNECREIPWSVLELLLTRLNCTSVNDNGVQIVPKLYCDENPGSKRSWPYIFFHRKLNAATHVPVSDPGRIASMHFSPRDNPHLSSDYISSLEDLGPDAKRQYLVGEYGSFSGRVLKFSDDHVIDDFKMPHPENRTSWVFLRAIDFGFWPDAFCCLWLAHDKVRGTITVYRERYEHQITAINHARAIMAESVNDLSRHERAGRRRADLERTAEMLFRPSVCDHDSSDQADLRAAGMRTRNAEKSRRAGIMNMIELFDNGPGSGKTRVQICRSCTHLITEIEAWRWKDTTESARKVNDMDTVGEDHAMDALRYGLMDLHPPRSPSLKMNPLIPKKS